MHVDPALMPPQPAFGDRTLDTGAVFGRGAASVEEWRVYELDRDPAVLDRFGCVACALAIMQRGR